MGLDDRACLCTCEMCRERGYHYDAHCAGPHPYDPRPCKSRNTNVCVAEGCYGEACINGGAS